MGGEHGAVGRSDGRAVAREGERLSVHSLHLSRACCVAAPDAGAEDAPVNSTGSVTALCSIHTDACVGPSVTGRAGQLCTSLPTGG